MQLLLTLSKSLLLHPFLGKIVLHFLLIVPQSTLGGISQSKLGSKYPHWYTLGCPCHLIHNIAYYGLEDARVFDVEGVVVDVLFLITPQRGREFEAFCIAEHRNMLSLVRLVCKTL